MYNSTKLCKPIYFLLILSLIGFSSLIVTLTSIQTFSAEVTSTSQTFTSDITHTHSGNSSSGGACYGKQVTETKTYEDYCSGVMVYYPEWNSTVCNFCGASYSGDQSGRRCYYVNYTYKTESYYPLTCKLKNNSVVGTFSVTPDKTEWTKEVTLDLDISPSSLAASDNPYSINSESISGSSFLITDNGTYTANASLSVKSKFNPITIEVNNIDVTAPDFSLEYDDTSEMEEITLSITANDLQPDGTNGCGLSAEAFSYDDEQTWTDSSSMAIKLNGDYIISVRDQLGNTSSKTVTISNIKPPKKDEPKDDTDKKPDKKPTNPPSDDNVGGGDNGGEGDNGGGGNGGGDNGDGNGDGDNGGGDNGGVDPADNTSPTVKDITPIKKPTPKNDDDEDPIDTDDISRVGVTPFPLPRPYKNVTVKENKIKTKEILSEGPSDDPISLEDSASDKSFVDYVPLIATIFLGILFLIAFILILYKIAFVYNLKSKDMYTFMGIAFIRKKDGMLSLYVSEDIIDSCDTGLLSIRPSFLFLLFNSDRDITIYLPDKQSYPALVEKDIKITMRN